MTVVRYEPWALLNRLHRELDQTFETSARDASWTPAVDIHEEAEAVRRARRSAGREARRTSRSPPRRACSPCAARAISSRGTTTATTRASSACSGKFVRTFTLPENVQTDPIKAKFKDGVLELTIPKIAKAEPRRIEVQAA